MFFCTTNYFSFFNSAYRLVFKMYPSLSHCFTVFYYHQLIVTFSLHGTVVSALCALLHAPRLLQVAYCTHCICSLNCWVNKVKTRGHTAARKTPNTDTRRRKQSVEAATASWNLRSSNHRTTQGYYTLHYPQHPPRHNAVTSDTVRTRYSCPTHSTQSPDSNFPTCALPHVLELLVSLTNCRPIAFLLQVVGLHFVMPLKPPFSANPSHRSLSFSSSGLTTWFPRLLLLLLSISVFTFSLFCFTLLVVGSVRQIKLTHVGFRTHVKIASRIVSYRIVS